MISDLRLQIEKKKENQFQSEIYDLKSYFIILGG